MPSIDEQFSQYSRLVRPFSVKRLHDDLYHVLATAGHIRNLADALLMDPPVTPEEYMAPLHEIGCALETLADACDETVPKIERLIEAAPAEHRRGLEALVRIVRGLQADAALEAGEAPDVALAA